MFRGPSPTLGLKGPRIRATYSKRGRFSIFRFVMLGLVFDGFWNGLGHCFCTFFCETKASRGTLYSKTDLYPIFVYIYIYAWMKYALFRIVFNYILYWIILNLAIQPNLNQIGTRREKRQSLDTTVQVEESGTVLSGSSVRFFGK